MEETPGLDARRPRHRGERGFEDERNAGAL